MLPTKRATPVFPRLMFCGMPRGSHKLIAESKELGGSRAFGKTGESECDFVEEDDP